MRIWRTLIVAAVMGPLLNSTAFAGVATPAIREAAEHIMATFGKGAAGQSLDEVTEATARMVARHGDDAVPFLRRTGHVGYAALENAGTGAPAVIKLYARRGNEAIWLVSKPNTLALFLKHGDSAADALIKHPGIADTLIGRYGDAAAGALNSVSRQGGQRLGMLAKSGVLDATSRSPELLGVIRRYGDEAMAFIWRNKGALAVATLLGSFLADPEAYISGAKQLIVDPVVAPIATSTNWTLVLLVTVAMVLLAGVAHRLLARAMRPNTPDSHSR